MKQFNLVIWNKRASITLDNERLGTDDMEWIDDLTYSTYQLYQLFGPPCPVVGQPLSRWEWKLHIQIGNIDTEISIYDWGEFKCPHCDYTTDRRKIFHRHLLSKHNSHENLEPIFTDFNDTIWCVASDSDFKSHRNKAIDVLRQLLESNIGVGHYDSDDSDSDDSDSDDSDSD